MPLPNSDVKICNLAFDYLKQEPISSITTPTTKAESLAARWYTLGRLSLLESYNWNFASTGEAIPRGGTPSVGAYTDYYVFPNNYLKLQAIVSHKIPLTRYDYKLEGNTILYSNGAATSLDVWFIQNIQDLSAYPAVFIELFVLELARKFARKITGIKPSVLQDLRTDLTEARQRALAFNGQTQPPKRYEQSRLVNAGTQMGSSMFVAGAYEFWDDA